MKGKQGKNPFKGLYYYEEADKDIFHGRENESEELLDLVTLNVLTVVFGKSGIGKTSLLNAGLFPLLREKDFLPVKLWLDYSSSGLPLLDQVKQAIQKELKDHNIAEIEKGGSDLARSFSEGETLWGYFHRVDHLDENGKAVTPVLVFDQFEELFTIGKYHARRDSLIDELYWLVEDQVPAAVKERILTHRETIPYLRAQTAVRVVLGLREDYLPHLNALKRRIPSIHRVLFRIIHLNGFQARQVMDKSGAFRDDKIKQDILHQFYPGDMAPGQTVPDEKLEVEPALLSLLCYQVFEQGVETLSIREKDAILAEFYDQVLGELPQGKELEEWIETNLLTEGGFRTPLYLERAHALRDTVDAAVDKKLLRKLYIGEKEHVEIIHDVLAPVIKERRNRRIEEKRRLEKRKETELRRKRVITWIILTAGIISILLAIFAFYQKNRADEQYRETVCFRLASESGLILLTDNVKAIRIAEAAYKISKSSPPAAVVRALSAAAYSNWKRPFYTASLNHEAEIQTAVFSPDGSKILTASNDKTAKLWDLKGHTDVVNSVVFSPDGKRILTASDDLTTIIWPTPESIMEWLKTAPIPKLTPQEKEELGIANFDID
jgi:hypothetical protein